MRLPSWGSFLIMSLIIFVLFSLWAKVARAQTDPSDFYVDCWEACFDNSKANVGSSGTVSIPAGDFTPNESLKDEYDQIYKMIEAARTTRLVSGTNSTLFVFDTSLAQSNPSLSQLLMTLAEITALATPVTTSYNPMYVVLFNGDQAWYQDSWQGLGRCDAVGLFKSLELTPTNSIVEYGPGKIENACLVGAHAMDLIQNGSLSTAVYDSSFVTNPVVFGFVGSKFETFESKCGAKSFYSPTSDEETDSLIQSLNARANLAELPNPGADFNPYCARYFTERFIIGTGSSDSDDLEAWSFISADIVKGSSYAEPTSDFNLAAQQIVECMREECCPPGVRMEASRDFSVPGACITADEQENFFFCDFQSKESSITI